MLYIGRRIWLISIDSHKSLVGCMGLLPPPPQPPVPAPPPPPPPLPPAAAATSHTAAEGTGRTLVTGVLTEGEKVGVTAVCTERNMSETGQ